MLRDIGEKKRVDARSIDAAADDGEGSREMPCKFPVAAAVVPATPDLFLTDISEHAEGERRGPAGLENGRRPDGQERDGPRHPASHGSPNEPCPIGDIWVTVDRVITIMSIHSHARLRDILVSINLTNNYNVDPQPCPSL